MSAALVAALILDALFGEPRVLWDRFPHPAVVMGRAVAWLDRHLNRGPARRTTGILAVLLLVGGAILLGLVLAALPGRLIDVIIAAILLSQRSLADHVARVAQGLRLSVAAGRSEVAMIVSRELDIRTVDTISVKSYHSGGGKADQRREAQVLKAPDATLMGDGTGILIVDDLVDTGKTLELVRSHYPKAHVATVYAKRMGRPQVDTFITEVSQDTWIFFPWDMALQYVEPYRGSD